MDQAAWFDIVLPFHFGMPRFDIMMILTMSLIMVVVMIESTGMFLALGSDVARNHPEGPGGACAPTAWARCWAASSTPSVHQLLAERGAGRGDRRQSRYVCRRPDPAGAGPAAQDRRLVESLPTVVLGGAGIVMFGMVAATGIRILSGVDFKTNRNNAMIVAVSIGIGMVPLTSSNGCRIPCIRWWSPASCCRR